MGVASGAGCAQISRALDEPMAGTAPSTHRWLCLECPPPWPDDVSRHADPAIREFLARGATLGLRPLLIRSRDHVPDRGRSRVFLVDTLPGAAMTTVLAVGPPAELDGFPLPGPDDPLPGDPVTEPLLLVCTHAERDPCCGLDGKALAEELGGPDVFECSHLGGHRFAPTALVLPSGYVYGRLEPASAAAVHTRARSGAVTLDHCRGRCTWSPRGQVAELAVRAATGLCSPDDLVVLDDTAEVVSVTSPGGQRWAVDLELLEVDATRPVSCGARPTLPAPLRAAAVHALGPVPDPP